MTLRLIAALSVACALQAQSLTANATTPLGVSVSLGGVPSSTMTPAGPLPNTPSSIGIAAGTAPGPTVSATLSHSVSQGGGVLLFQLQQHLQAQAAPTDSASIAPAEILLQFNTPVPTSVTLYCTLQLAVSSATVTPSIQVDIGDDGTIDVTNPTTAFQTGLTLGGGTGALPVRVAFGADVIGEGEIQSVLLVHVVPSNTNTFQIAQPCGNYSITPYPQFNGNVYLSTVPQLFQPPMVAVIGLTTSPVLLGPAPGPIPCLLVASPDVTVFVPPTSFGFELTIPPAARPIDLFTQTVALENGSLLTGTGWWLQAY